jgi:ribosomal-protein-alanine N-acetyltransferase
MIVRKCRFEDNLQIFNIESQTFKDAWTRKMLADTFLLDNFMGFVAVAGGQKIIGYLLLTHCLDEAEIDRIAVIDEYKRQGVATLLLKTAFDELLLKDVHKVFLEVRRSNESAQALYEKNGFTYVGVRPLYYNGKEDALLMSKLLKE